MKKKDKIIFLLVGIMIIALLAEPIYKFVKSSSCAFLYYATENQRYLWLFNDSIRDGVEIKYSSKKNRETYLYNYRYKDLGFVIIEDSSAENHNIPHIVIKEDKTLDKNIKDTYTSLHLGSFNLSLVACRKHLERYIIKMDQQSRLISNKNEENFHSLYFKFNTFSISNESGEDHLFSKVNDMDLFCNLVFYKKGVSNFIILLYSEKDFLRENEIQNYLNIKRLE